MVNFFENFKINIIYLAASMNVVSAAKNAWKITIFLTVTTQVGLFFAMD